MNPLRKLAGQTALYGVSSILARIINYFLLPIHTRVLPTEEMGIMSELYAWVALLNVLFTFGMETAFFRFMSRDKSEEVYHATATFVILISLVLSSFIWLSADGIAAYLDISNSARIVRIFSVILFLDAAAAIPFARLRMENRPLRFATVKSLNIFLMFLLNVLFLWVIPSQGWEPYTGFLSQYYADGRLVDFVFYANLAGSASVIFLLYGEFNKIRLRLPVHRLRTLLPYAFPIFIMGISGIINEQVDKIMLEDLLPEGFLPGLDAREVLGIYGAVFKLSMFMALAIQAFRFAGEPFFFGQAENKEAPELFAKVLHYFTLFSLILFVGVSLNMELISLIFLQDRVYWIGLEVVPLLLFAKVFYGIYVNLSIWFKLTDRTHFGTWFSLLGAAVTIGCNLLLIPHIGYFGSAVAAILCYITMCAVCYYYGQKYFPVPYRLRPLALHTLGACTLVSLFIFWQPEHTFIIYALKFGISVVYAGWLFFMERRQLIPSKQ